MKVSPPPCTCMPCPFLACHVIPCMPCHHLQVMSSLACHLIICMSCHHILHAISPFSHHVMTCMSCHQCAAACVPLTLCLCMCLHARHVSSHHQERNARDTDVLVDARTTRLRSSTMHWLSTVHIRSMSMNSRVAVQCNYKRYLRFDVTRSRCLQGMFRLP